MPLPGPEVYWMQAWEEWFQATFWMVVARHGSEVVLINTGPPDDLDGLNELWRNSHPARPEFTRLAEHEPLTALAAMGIAPEDVTRIILTPVVAYSVGALHKFPNAEIYFSRRGWIEDVLAPPHQHHLPREIFAPDQVLSWLLFEAKDRVNLINGSQEIVPGLRVWESGVHHRSSLVVEFDTEQGIVAVTDSAFAYENIEENIYLGIGESYAEAMQSYARIRERADFYLPLYDPRVTDRLKAFQEGQHHDG